MSTATEQLFNEISNISISLQCDGGFLVDMGLAWSAGHTQARMRAEYPEAAERFAALEVRYGREAMTVAFQQRERQLLGLTA